MYRSILCSIHRWKPNQYIHEKKDRNIVQIGDDNAGFWKNYSRGLSLVRVYHLSVEWDLLSMSSEFTPYSFEAEVSSLE